MFLDKISQEENSTRTDALPCKNGDLLAFYGFLNKTLLLCVSQENKKIKKDFFFSVNTSLPEGVIKKSCITWSNKSSLLYSFLNAISFEFEKIPNKQKKSRQVSDWLLQYCRALYLYEKNLSYGQFMMTKQIILS